MELVQNIVDIYGDVSRGWPEGSFFNSYHTEVLGWRNSILWIAPLYP